MTTGYFVKAATILSEIAVVVFGALAAREDVACIQVNSNLKGAS